MTVIINWLGNTRVIELSSSFEIVFRPLRFDYFFIFLNSQIKPSFGRYDGIGRHAKFKFS